MTTHNDPSEALLAELHTADPPARRRRTPRSYLVAPCPLCGVAIEFPANSAGADVRLVASGDGWQSFRATVTARATGVHVHVD